MKGVGGPLLCIGDLLSDLEEPQYQEDKGRPIKQSSSSSPSSPVSGPINDDLDLTKLFQDNFTNLNEALAGTDHSWTTLTLKLCNAMEAANKLVESTNSDVRLLIEKVKELERVVKRGDSVVANAKALQVSFNQDGGTSFGRN